MSPLKHVKAADEQQQQQQQGQQGRQWQTHLQMAAATAA